MAFATHISLPPSWVDNVTRYIFSDWKSGQSIPESWDVSDAIADGWKKAEIDEFMRTLVRPWTPNTNGGNEGVKVVKERDHKHNSEARPSRESLARSPIKQLKNTNQEKPVPATVTDIRTRKTHDADKAYEMEFVCGPDGSIKSGVTKNWMILLENDPEMKGVFAYDSFKLNVMVMRRPPWIDKLREWDPRPIQDRDYSETVMWLESKYMTPKATTIAPVLHTIAERNSFDRLKDYLYGLEWDMKPRVISWLSEYLGIEDTPYSRTVGLRWLVASVARGLMPGCKVDTMPILEGTQGARKSTAIRVLYGDEFFTDELSDIGSKDAMMEMQGVWGLEVAEMHRFSASETNAVKKFLTRQTDRFRPPYGRNVIEAPRRVILNGTINPEGNGYLRDVTGARRFWPLSVGKIAIDKLARDRDQIWAEAVVMFKEGVPWWVQENETRSVELEQEKRTDIDAWTSKIASLLNTRTTISQTDIFDALSIPIKDADYRHSGRIGRIMKKAGWDIHKDTFNGSGRITYIKQTSAWMDDSKDGWE